MYHEVCMAILPPHSLAETLRDWDEIAEQLAEPNRTRSRYVFYYVNAYWGPPRGPPHAGAECHTAQLILEFWFYGSLVAWRATICHPCGPFSQTNRMLRCVLPVPLVMSTTPRTNAVLP